MSSLRFTFLTASWHLNHGGRVRRESWHEDTFLTLLTGVNGEKCFNKHSRFGVIADWRPSANDIYAEDWQLVYAPTQVQDSSIS